MIINKIKDENNFYIDIDLGFFEGDKTEKPTARKKEKAVEKGQFAISQEIATAVMFIFGFITLRSFAASMYEKSMELFYNNLILVGDIDKIFEMSYITKFISFIFLEIIMICLPIFGIIMLLGLISNIAQVGWHPNVTLLKPKMSAFNPINGVKKLVSFKSIVEFIKSMLKLGVIGFAIYSCIKGEVTTIQTLLMMDLFQGFKYIGNLSMDIGIKVGQYFIVIAILDYAYQKHSHTKKLKMSKQEVKDEYKMSEGDPQIKSRIRQKMREVSMRRMMQEIPNADVIITNPTHYAVAIKYDREKSAAPIVVAKGVDHLARRIKEAAKDHNIEIVENKPLARALYNSAEVGREIPQELYQAVAEVLAFVYRLRNVM